MRCSICGVTKRNVCPAKNAGLESKFIKNKRIDLGSLAVFRVGMKLASRAGRLSNSDARKREFRARFNNIMMSKLAVKTPASDDAEQTFPRPSQINSVLDYSAACMTLSFVGLLSDLSWGRRSKRPFRNFPV